MKHPLYILTILTAAAVPAGAWPFVIQTSVDGIDGEQFRGLACQLDKDRPLEYFRGGDSFMNNAPGSGGSPASLPRFDYDPYPSGTAAVAFQGDLGDAGDIDGDGDIDIVRTGALSYGGTVESNKRIMTCLNDGNGNFTRGWHFKQTQPDGKFHGASVRLADLDRDGDLDLIEAGDVLRVRWNPGDGNFGGASTTLLTGYSTAPLLEVADFDGNGWMDIAFAASFPAAGQGNFFGRLHLLSNTGGTLSGAAVQTLSVSESYTEIGSADVDEDGLPDLLISSTKTAGAALNWLRSTGTGFAAPASLLSLPGPGYAPAFATGDINEDGRADIVYFDGDDAVQWLRKTSPGTYALPALLRNGPGPGSGFFTYHSLCIADIDADGDNDIMVDGGKTFMQNTAIHQEAAASVTAHSGTMPSGAVDLTTGDVNNDGKEDLIAADGGGKRLLWYAGTGTGLSPANLPVSTGSVAPSSVTAGDFNRDGWTDLAWVGPNVINQVISANGSGSSWQNSNIAIANLTGVTRILAADVDRDSDIDLLAMSPTQGILRWIKNDGTAALWLPENVATGQTGLSAISCGELIPGGRAEVGSLIAGAGPATASWHNYGSAWKINTLATSAAGSTSSAMILADVSAATPGSEIIYAMNGSSFYVKAPGAAAAILGGFVSSTISQLAAVDWDSDGYTDILIAGADGVRLFVNKRGAAWLDSIPLQLFNGAVQDLVVMDFNLDGRPDAAAVQTSGQIQLISNRSGAVRMTFSNKLSLPLLPGETGVPVIISGRNQGRTTAGGYAADACAGPSAASLRFLRSTISGGIETPGTPLTQAEVSALVESLSIQNMSGSSLTNAAPANVTNGLYTLPLSAQARASLCALPGAISNFRLAVKLKSTAATASVTRFYLDYSPASTWIALDSAAGNAGGATPLTLSGNTDLQRTLISVAEPTPLDLWRMANFNTYTNAGSAANDADPDKDGVGNLIEYVMNRNPLLGTGAFETSPVIGLTPQGMNAPLLADLRLLSSYDSKVRVTLESSANLKDWSVLSTRIGSASGWTGLQPAGSGLQGGRTKFLFNTGTSPATTPKYFLRLKAEELP